MVKLEEYYTELMDKLAVACMDRLPDGTCAPPEGRRCALDLNLKEIVEAVKAVKSNDMSDYAGQIRAVVCEQCINQDEHGHCEVRESMDCCLDNFMTLAVDAIEEVDNRHARDASAPG